MNNFSNLMIYIYNFHVILNNSYQYVNFVLISANRMHWSS